MKAALASLALFAAGSPAAGNEPWAAKRWTIAMGEMRDGREHKTELATRPRPCHDAVEATCTASDAETVAALLPKPTLAAAPARGRTIVGRWSPSPRSCLPLDGAIVIGPLEIVADEFTCSFASVARQGEVVTWKGTCGFPEKPEKATVVATRSGETLRLRINGADSGPYYPCPGRS